MTQMEHEALITSREVARLLGLTVRAVDVWRIRGQGPPFIRIGKRCVRYKKADVEAWIESQRVQYGNNSAGE